MEEKSKSKKLKTIHWPLPATTKNQPYIKGKRVSKHCVSVDEYNKMNIADIEIPSGDVKKFIAELSNESNVVNIFHDIKGIEDTGKIKRLAKEPCIHVEIKQ